MPRSRLIVLIWCFGLLVLAGSWGHSLVRKTILRYSNTDSGVRWWLGVVAGSVEFYRCPIWGNDKTRFQIISMPLEQGKVPAPVPTYKFGRFLHRKTAFATPRGPRFITTLEVPLWALALPWTLLCLPLYWRTRRRQRHPPPDFEATAPDST